MEAKKEAQMSIWTWMKENLYTAEDVQIKLEVSRHVIEKMKRGKPLSMRIARKVEKNSNGYFKTKDLVGDHTFKYRPRKKPSPKEEI
jgi:hypothetical protein